MMKRTFLLLAFLSLFPALLRAQENANSVSKPSSATAPAPVFGEKLHINGIPNTGKLNDFLYRGAQPRKPGFAELKKLGITTIVDLRGEDRERITWERKQAEALGIRFVNIPVSGWAPPTNAQVAQFLSLFHDDPKEKVFVHCRFGDDRTGVFVASYRMAMEKWTDEQAIKEMYFFGFNGFWHPAMKTFVHEFPARLKYSPDLYSLPSPAPAP
jgi:protein tyrosine phosphatase (PTP) superfamily phosphohydrolase (DUF442 family)